MNDQRLVDVALVDYSINEHYDDDYNVRDVIANYITDWLTVTWEEKELLERYSKHIVVSRLTKPDIRAEIEVARTKEQEAIERAEKAAETAAKRAATRKKNAEERKRKQLEKLKKELGEV